MTATFMRVPGSAPETFVGSAPYSSRLVARIGKRAAGRRLDGREHNEMPEVRP